MFKVMDPSDNVIMAVFPAIEDVPDRVWNRGGTYSYPKDECEIIQVIGPVEQDRLRKTMETTVAEYPEVRRKYEDMEITPCTAGR